MGMGIACAHSIVHSQSTEPGRWYGLGLESAVFPILVTVA